jgi:hypothetical protein
MYKQMVYLEDLVQHIWLKSGFVLQLYANDDSAVGCCCVLSEGCT